MALNPVTGEWVDEPYVPERVTPSEVNPFDPRRMTPEALINTDPAVFAQVNPAQPNVGLARTLGVTPGADGATPTAPGVAAAPGVAPAAHVAPQASVDLLYNRLAELRDKETTRETELATHQEKSAAAFEAERAPLEAGIEADYKSMAQLEAEYAKQPRDLPQWKPEPIVNPKDFEQFSFMLLAMALVGGIRGGEAWTNAATALNGAMDGYITGAKDKMNQQWQEYQQQYRLALDQQKGQQKEFEDSLRARNTSINQKIREQTVLAARYGREDIRVEADMRRDIAGIERQITTVGESITRTESANARLRTSMEEAMMRANAGNAENNLSSDAGKVASLIDYKTGKPGALTHALYARYTKQSVVPPFNNMVAEMLGQGRTLDEIASSYIGNEAQWVASRSALRVNTIRTTGVQRLTESIGILQVQMLALARKVVPTDTPIANVTLNWLNQYVAGDKDLASLKVLIQTIGRQYMEAVTMPGSNAQLHAGSNDLADQMISANMTFDQINGAIWAMNQEIQATAGSLTKTSAMLIRSMTEKFPDQPDKPTNLQVDIQRRLDETGEQPAAAPPAAPWATSGAAPAKAPVKRLDYNSLPP